jgi:superfamily II DNA or RNA helicase
MSIPIELRPYQNESVEGLRANIRDGIKNQVLCSPTGSGKTVIALYLLDECRNKNKRAIFVVERLPLVEQTSAMLDKFGIDHGVIQGNHWRTRPGEKIQVATAQTLDRRGWPDADLIIVDECFTGETLITTPTGDVRIDSLRQGDLILSACGESHIASVFCKQVYETITLHLSNGSIIRTTKDHPFFTSMGWRCAGSLEGSLLLHQQNVRDLWSGVLSENYEFWSADKRTSIQRTKMLQHILREEIEQSDVQSSLSEQNVGNTAKNKAQTKTQGREWNGADENSEEITRNFRWWMADGICGENYEVECSRVSSSLQTGLSKPIIDDRRRTRRKQPLFTKAKGCGCEKRSTAEVVRVEAITHEKHAGGIFVYNLRVKSHPSYFAGGFLVHNCHVMHKDTLKKIVKRDSITIGLTATPFTRGMGRFYDKVVNVTTSNKLMDEGFLVPAKIFAASQPDMTGAKVVAGEWTDAECSSRAMPIIGDCVAEYLKHGNDKKFIAFGVDVEHCKEMQKQFMAAGVICELHTYQDGDKIRETNMIEFRKPNSYIRGLISVSALSRGLDVPDVSCVIMCRPLRKAFSEFIQVIGRGLRPYPNKEHCIILDHSGNYSRFFGKMQDLFEEGVHELDTGEKEDKEKKKKEDKEKEPVKCPKCHHVHTPMPTCPACGNVYPKKETVTHEAGELHEVGSIKRMSTDEKRTLYGELKWIASSRNWSKGALAHKFREIAGVWPNNYEDAPMLIATQKTINKVQQLHIAWLKSERYKQWKESRK